MRKNSNILITLLKSYSLQGKNKQSQCHKKFRYCFVYGFFVFCHLFFKAPTLRFLSSSSAPNKCCRSLSSSTLKMLESAVWTEIPHNPHLSAFLCSALPLPWWLLIYRMKYSNEFYRAFNGDDVTNYDDWLCTQRHMKPIFLLLSTLSFTWMLKSTQAFHKWFLTVNCHLKKKWAERGTKL